MASSRSSALPLPQRLLVDLVEFAARQPVAVVRRRLRLGAVADARTIAHPRPGWCAVFTKALALAAGPDIRRVRLSTPWARWYVHPTNVVNVAVERLFGNELSVFLAPVPRAETLALADLDAAIRGKKDCGLETVAAFRRQMRLAALPWPLRRTWLHGVLNMTGGERVRLIGTVAVVALTDPAASLQPPALPIPVFSYGPVEPGVGTAGDAEASLTFDPRCVPVSAAARLLEDVERVLRHEILAELRYLEDVEAA